MAEAIVKIIGLRYYYFTVPWNVFDFVLVLASIVDLMVGDLTVEFPIPPTMLRIVRVFRIGRVLRLVKAAKGIRKLLFALVVSLPALFNIGALLALITFIYAILGMALFGRAPRKWSIDDEGGLNLLFGIRLMTAAGWNEVLDSLTVVEPVCGSYRHIKCGLDGEPDCPSRALVVAYIVTYLIVSYLIVINMYIAIILENFVEANKEEEVGIVEDDLEMFYVRWSRYDPQATQFINFEQISDFLASLDPPLALPKPNMALVAFNLPIARGNKIHCLDILHALVKHVLGQIDDSEEFRKLQEQMERKFQKQFPTRKLLDIVSSTRLWKIQQNAAIIIQRGWRKYRLRKYPPTEKSKATQTNPRVNPNAVPHTGLGGMMNRVGNLLHLSSGAAAAGHPEQQQQLGTNNRGSKRRESMAMREPTSGVVTQQMGSSSSRTRRSQDRISESSVTSSPTALRLETSPEVLATAASSFGNSQTNRGWWRWNVTSETTLSIKNVWRKL
ncbi:Sodium channel protein 60E [Orchesella cincta]|uniref:Sodium channel protein n=1 Tax=Orchesella cincta TaxID=48709 RepID=A0A1D2MKH9_ORCCI|nr:Sodium channel protein 60E [Orchesella cincta]